MTYENINFSKPNMVMAEGYFFMFDETNNTVVQKTAGGKIIFIYPLNINLLYKYYEASFDNNTYDTNLWTVDGTYGGFRNDAFWSKGAAGVSGCKFFRSKFMLRGQFDAEVKYKLITAPSVVNWAAVIQLEDVISNNNLIISIQYISGNKSFYGQSRIAGVYSQVGSTITIPDIDGKVRLYRAAGSSTTTLYYLNSSGVWTTIGSNSTSLGLSSNIQGTLYAGCWSTYPEVEAEFDDFFVSIGLSSIKSVQYDGRYFWTLQSINGTSEPIVRKWLFNNYECKLQDEFIFSNTSTQIYNANSFAVEHYITKLNYSISEGATILNTEDYSENVITSGTVLSIGPNDYDFCEDAVVSGVVGSDIVLTSGTQYSYEADDQVSLSRSILLLNEYYGTISTSGSLMRFSSVDGSFLSSDAHTDYKSVIAATFARVQGLLRNNDQDIYDTIDDAYALIYIKDTSAKFRNLSDLLSAQNAYSVNDSFVGSDYSLPDTTMWLVTNGDPIIYNNTLTMSTEIDGYDEIESNYIVMNDFDIQISGSIAQGYTTINTFRSYFIHYLQALISGTSYSLGTMYQGVGASTISGMSVEYTMDSVSGTTIYDTSGNENNATMSGITYSTGKVGNAATISTKTAYMKLGSTVSGSVVSASMWYYYGGIGTGPYNTLIGRDGSSYHHLMVSGTSNQIGFWNGAWYSSGTALVSGTWYHIALIKNGTNSKLYLNKNLIQNSNSSFNNATYPIRTIGNNIAISGTYGCLGKIDQVRIFDGIELTTADVEALYAEGYYGTYANNLLMYTNSGGTLSFINASGTDYLLRMKRSAGTLNYYYKPVLSGTPATSWTSFGSSTVGIYDCNILLGLTSTGLTVSGAVFDDLTYNSGYIKYPLSTIPYYGIMTMDNLKADNTTTIPIYSISYNNGTLYRLQNITNYYGTNYTWTYYNYVVSTVKSFIDAITMTTYPTILPADGRNISTITCAVLDQYGNGAVNAPITFTDNDSYGYVTINPKYTDYYYGDGEAITYYKAGIDSHRVTISGVVTQYD